MGCIEESSQGSSRIGAARAKGLTGKLERLLGRFLSPRGGELDHGERRLTQCLRDEEGQTLPWMALFMVVMIGMGGLSTDLGHAYICYRELQASTDAAALAGAYEMASSTATTSSVQTAVSNFSSTTGGANANPNLPSTQLTTTLKCLTSVPIPCTATSTANNALQVTQTVKVPTYFIRALSIFGVKAAQNMTLKATSTVAMRGASNAPYNIAIVIDTTASMGQSDTDASCNNKRITCALQGVRTLLQSLTPCAGSTKAQGCPAFDQVSLFTYPNIEADTAKQNGTCPGSPKVMSYSVPGAGATWVATDFSSKNPTYQLTPYTNDYSSTWSYGSALSTSSQVAVDSGAKSGCSGLQTPGGVQTYFAGAIYAAQSSLIAAQASHSGSVNAMIILSDGDANSSSINGASHNPKGNSNVIYGSLDNLCQQAIAAAQAATAAGTQVYSIAYGAASSGCSTDVSGPQKGISPCSTMQQLASSAGNFYSDATASANKGQCTSTSNPNLTLNNIFHQITYNFTVPRLLPNNAQ